MEKKIHKNLTLYKDNIDYIDQVKVEQNLSSQSAALDFIISQYKAGNSDQTKIIADAISDKLIEKYDNLFTRLRLGVNTSDRNSQVILEILNSLIINQGVEKSYDTEILESTIVKDSKDLIKKRIQRYKEIKDNK